ncbi:hypothetical protein REC12_08285 [Desulfosporosinus sp. PR]|uniref:hypothetical protein n=1 Tax=Candidatus Desulfosporosinus nitrosoreducens TaxID=3401928 RepID=UPI0027E697F6|nr:hypothetical protein [Desulfosporosinus sp. PR]MDQ7093584.1 hypothetical protein [Desulfosporosinus sp. PR]
MVTLLNMFLKDYPSLLIVPMLFVGLVYFVQYMGAERLELLLMPPKEKAIRSVLEFLIVLVVAFLLTAMLLILQGSVKNRNDLIILAVIDIFVVPFVVPTVNIIKWLVTKNFGKVYLMSLTDENNKEEDWVLVKAISTKKVLFKRSSLNGELSMLVPITSIVNRTLKYTKRPKVQSVSTNNSQPQPVDSTSGHDQTQAQLG